MSLRVAIVGAGWMGQVHAQAICAAGDVVTAAVDPDIARAERLVAEYGHADSRAFSSIAELLAETPELSAAAITSPSAAHLGHVAELANGGVPLLVEKPPWIVSEDPSCVIEQIAVKRVPVLVGMTTRFDPGIRALHNAACAGRFGRILSVSDEIFFRLEENQLAAWYSASPSQGGGAVLTNGVHAVDRVGWILGEPLRLRAAMLRTVDARRASEDFAMLSLAPGRPGRDVDDAPDVRVTLLWSKYQPSVSRLLIVGSEGTGWADGNGGWVIRTGADEVVGQRPHDHDNHREQWRSFRSMLITGRSDGQLANYGELAAVMTVLGDALRVRL